MPKENVIKISMSAVQMTGVAAPGDLRAVLCEGKGLDRYILFGSRAEKEAFQNVSCSLSPMQLINAQRVLLQNLDGRKLLSEASRPAPINALALALNFRSALIPSGGGDAPLHPVALENWVKSCRNSS